MRPYLLALSSLLALALVAPQSPALAKSARKKQQEMTAEIPICTQKLGTIAVVEPDQNWWSGLGLSSPEAIIKLFVMRSGCFGLVDRNKGLASRNIERALADNGELQEGSNIGRAQVKAADYFLVPDLISKNANAGGTNLGGLAGGLLGNSTFGAIAGGISINKKEANVLLTLVNARTTEQERMSEGHFKKTDVGFALGGGAGWWGGFGALGASSYANTEIGQVVVLAYLKAYRDMVGQLGGLPANPSAAAPVAR